MQPKDHPLRAALGRKCLWFTAHGNKRRGRIVAISDEKYRDDCCLLVSLENRPTRKRVWTFVSKESEAEVVNTAARHPGRFKATKCGRVLVVEERTGRRGQQLVDHYRCPPAWTKIHLMPKD